MNNLPKIVREYHANADPLELPVRYTAGNFSKLIDELGDPAARERVVRHVWGPAFDTVWSQGKNCWDFSYTEDGNIVLKSGVGFHATNKLLAATMWIITLGMLRQKQTKGTIPWPVNISGTALAPGVPLVKESIACEAFGYTAANKALDALSRVQFTVRQLLQSPFPEKCLQQTARRFSRILIGKDSSKWAAVAKQLENRLKLDIGSIAHAAVAYGMALDNPHAAVVTSWKAFCAIQPIVGESEIPENLYFGELNTTLRWWHHNTTAGELLFAAMLLGAATPPLGNGKQALRVSVDGEFPRIYFENEYLEITDAGVVDDRARQVNNTLIVSHPDVRVPVAVEHMSLANSYGSVLFALVNNVRLLLSSDASKAQQVGLKASCVASAFRALIRGELIAFDSEEESGGVSIGDRGYYNQYVTRTLQTDGLLPVFISKGTDGPILKVASEVKTEPYSGQLARLDAAAFDLRLARMHKGKQPLVNGSTMGVRINFFPEAAQEEVLKQVVAKATGKPTVEGLRLLFPELKSLAAPELVAIAKRDLFIGGCTKLSKLTPRIRLNAAKHAYPIAGEDSAFRLYGQNTGFSPGHVYNCVIAQRAIFTPGQSIQLVDSLKPAKVAVSYKEELEFYTLQGVETYKQQPLVKQPDDTYLIDYTGGEAQYKDYVLEGTNICEGETIIAIPHAQGMNFITAPDDAILTSVELSFSSFKNLVVTAHYFFPEEIGKLRSFVKTLPCKVPNGKEFLYNKMNSGLPEGIDLVIPGDADKSPALMTTLLPAAAQTYIKQGDMREELIRLNREIGIDETKGLVFSSAAAAIGHYDELIAKFEADYGRVVWLCHRDAASNQIAETQQLYINKVLANVEGWVRVDNKSFPEFPANATILANGNISSDKVDVLVFYSDDDPKVPSVMWQRTYAFVGVRVHVKFELSSVAQAVSTTRLMLPVARAIGTGLGDIPGDPQGAIALMKDYKSLMQRYFNILRLARRRTLTVKLAFKRGLSQHMCPARRVPKVAPKKPGGKPEPGSRPSRAGLKMSFHARMPVVTLLTSNYQLTETAKELFATPDWQALAREAQFTTLSLKALAAASKRIVFKLVENSSEFPYLHLPTIADMDLGARAKEGLSGLALTLFRWLLTGVNRSDKLLLRCQRIKAAMTNLAESEGLRKGITQGRVSAQCKLLGVPGVPIGEIWVLESDNRRSFYAKLARVFQQQGIFVINGKGVLVSRAPMPFPAKLKVRVIKPGDWEAYAVNEFQAAVSPLFCYVNGGDHDGDGYTVTPADDIDIPFLTVNTVRLVLLDRTGKEATAVEQSAYIADHYNIKKYKSLSLWGKANLTLTVRSCPGVIGDDELKRSVRVTEEESALDIERKGLITMFEHATKLNQGCIGRGHQFTYIADVAITVAKDCARALPESKVEALKTWLLDSGLILPLYELYENPLGGLSWRAWDALDELFAVAYTPKQERQTNDSSSAPLSMLAENLSEGGMNGSRAQNFYEVATFIKGTLDYAYVETRRHSNAPSFVQAAAHLTFLLGKGDFNATKHKDIVRTFVEFDPELKAIALKDSVSLRLLVTFIKGIQLLRK